MLNEQELAVLEKRLLKACREAEQDGNKISIYCCPFQALMRRFHALPPGPMTAAEFLGDESLEPEISEFMYGFDGGHGVWLWMSPMYRMGRRFRDLSLGEDGGFGDE